MSQCQCLKSNGQQCKNKSSSKSGDNPAFCWQHQDCKKSPPLVKMISHPVSKAISPPKTAPLIKTKATAPEPTYIDPDLFGAQIPKTGYTQAYQKPEQLSQLKLKTPIQEEKFTPTYPKYSVESLIQLLNMTFNYDAKTQKILMSPKDTKQLLVDFVHLLDVMDTLDQSVTIKGMYLPGLVMEAPECLQSLPHKEKVSSGYDDYVLVCNSPTTATCGLFIYDTLIRQESLFLLHDWIVKHFKKYPQTEPNMLTILNIVTNNNQKFVTDLPIDVKCKYYKIKVDANFTRIIQSSDLDKIKSSDVFDAVQKQPVHKFVF